MGHRNECKIYVLQGVADICEVCQVYPKSLAAGRMAMYPQQLQRGKATCIEPDNHRQFEATVFCPGRTKTLYFDFHNLIQ